MTALVQRQLDAYNSRDLDGFTACYHPEISVIQLVTNQTVVNGRDAFRRRYADLFNANPDLRGELRSRIVLSASVIDEEWVTGSSFAPNGLHTVAIYAFRDGLIDRVWFAR
jgi:hypothetical protein